MSEFNPLVQRVDALLKRHQQQGGDVQPAPAADLPAESPSADDAESPPDSHADAPLSQPEEPDHAHMVPLPDLLAAPDDDIPVLTEIVEQADEQAAAVQLDPAELAAEIESAILEQVLHELDRTLEQRLARTVADLLEQALHGVRAELSVSVRQMVRESVSSAVAKRIAERARSG